VVPEVLKGDRDAVEIARAHDLYLVTGARREREFLENGPAVFGKDKVLATCEKLSNQRLASEYLGKRHRMLEWVYLRNINMIMQDRE